MATVETPSAAHTEAAPILRRCRAAVAGQDAVAALTTEILPRPGGMSDLDYGGYLARALYMNATQRTHDSLVGLVMQKPAQQEMPSAVADLASYIDGRGSRLEDFARMAVSEVLEVGGWLAVVDHPQRPEGVITAAQERALGLRPVVSYYPRESVLEARTGFVNGNEEFTFLKLAETWVEDVDEWTQEAREAVRVYDMAEGRVRVRVYRKTAAGWVLYNEAFPTARSGKGLTYIPAVAFGPESNRFGKPPLLDLIDVNLAHYRNSADMEHALHFTGLPTPYASGVDPSALPSLTLGSSAGYVFEGENAKIQFATYGAEGLASLKQAMDDKVQIMAALGARMLAPESRAAESGEALAIRRGGENSALAKVADSVSRSVVLVLETLAEWEGITGAISYSLNTDYLPSKMNPQELTALMAAWQAGGLTSVELFDRLKSGGVIRDDKTYDEHEAELLDDGTDLMQDPALSGGMTTGQPR